MPSFEETFGELYRRVNRVERWIESFGDAKIRRVLGILSKQGIIVSTTRGLGAMIWNQHDPANQSYTGGQITTLLTLAPETDVYHSFLVVRWEIPAKVGDVEPQIRFRFSDGSFIIRTNGGGGVINESHASDVVFAKHGLTINQVEFRADNVGATQSVNLEDFVLEGWQI